MASVTSLDARKILDSRGEWTLEVAVELSNGMRAYASVPRGKSQGKHEVKMVSPDVAIENIVRIIKPDLIGIDPAKQDIIDGILKKLDDTPDKSRLGANAMLGVSLACARAAAFADGVPLWRHLRRLSGKRGAPERIPRLYINVINGGLHAGNNLDFQEYLIIPKASTFSEAADIGSRFYDELKKYLVETSGPAATNVGDEGGFASDFHDNLEPFRVLREVARRAGLADNINFGLDAAASAVDMPDEALLDLYRAMQQEFDLFYLEDPFGEEDFERFAQLKREWGEACTVTGDDLTTTNVARMEKARAAASIGGIIIKPNQIGTLTETLDAIRKAQAWGWRVVVSHRSGETNDDLIADLAYAVEADGIKLGAPARGERLAKYNRLLMIEKRRPEKELTLGYGDKNDIFDLSMLFHYYGDIERKLFIAGGMIMLFTLPFFNHLLPVPVLVSLGAILALTTFAGLMSPQQKWGAFANAVIAAGATGVFAFYAVVMYGAGYQDAPQRLLFWIDLVLAFDFLFAFYYSIKTLRGRFSAPPARP